MSVATKNNRTRGKSATPWIAVKKHVSQEKWAPAIRGTLSEHIINEIRKALFAGELTPGAFIGTEALVAERFGVSRIAARDALRSLTAYGIVEMKPGAHGGIRVAHGDPDRLADALAVQLALLGVKQEDVVSAQLAIETVVAELAAEMAGERDIEELRAIIDSVTKYVDSPEQWLTEMERFHGKLGEVSRNKVLQFQLKGLFQVLKPRYRVGLTSERMTRVTRSYSRLVNALASHDGDAARTIVREHLLKVRGILGS